jgi:hypothetical protein
MNKLLTDRINQNSPYDVEYDDELLVFTTEYGLTYAVDFDDDSNPFFSAYWLNLRNVYGQASPSDKKVAQTLICIIEEFFRRNSDVLLYICSSADGHQAQRARLFMRWFKGAEQKKLYVSRTVEVKGEGKIEYVALLAQRNRPDIDQILLQFDEETAMFNEMKP